MPEQKSDHKVINLRNVDMLGQQFVEHQESWDTAHLSVDLVLFFVVSHRAHIETCIRNLAQNYVCIFSTLR